MGFLDDAWDTVSKPFEAIFDIATASPGAVIDIARGKNIGDVTKDRLKQSLSGFGNLALSSTPLTAFAATQTGQGFFRSAAVDKLTLGAGGNFSGYASTAQKLADVEPKSVTKNEWVESGRWGLTVAAAAGGAAAAGAYGVGGSTIATGYTAAAGSKAALDRGDFFGAAVAAAGALPGVEIPQEAKDIYNVISPFVPKPSSSSPLAPNQNGFGDTGGIYGDAISNAGSSPLVPILIVSGVAIAGYYLYKKGRK